MSAYYEIPKDPAILLSFVNTKLRDEYSSLGELCKGLDISKDEVSETLQSIDYKYDHKTNQFI